MRKINLLICALLSMSCALYFVSCTNGQEAANKDATAVTPDPEAITKHGEYLVGIMGCNDCHSPKRMGEKGPEIIPELMLSGYPADRPVVEFKDSLIQKGFAIFYPDLTAAIGPWGTTFAGNLTPDETGIGNWTEEQFKKALTEGKFKGLDNGRMMLPPMPWQNYVNMSDEDINAIFAYLKSIKAVSNVVPTPIPPSPM